MYAESVRGFKSVFYGVRPMMTRGWNNFVCRGHRVDDQGRELTAEERLDYKKLKEFVEGLPPYLLEDSDGEPMFGEDGQRLTSTKVIATRELIVCDTSEKLTAFWSKMSSGAAALRQARAAKNKRETSNTAAASSALQSPTTSSAVDRAKRIRLNELEDTSSRQQQEIVDLEIQDDSTAPHKLTPGAPADDFVLPPIFAHGPLLDVKTKVKISKADEAILSDMGPEALRGEIATQTTALLKLIEVTTFLNNRECEYLAERDSVRKELQVLEKKLADSEASCEGYREEHKTLRSNLKEAEDKVKALVEEKESISKEVEDLKAKIKDLEGRLEGCQGAGLIEEGEKEVHPQGEYASSSRAVLIVKIQEYESNMVAAATFSFNNAVAQLRVLNPGLDEDKEVRDGQICSPPPSD
ncbi:hypothetical protein L195_g015771 [Trifolium pratense]|uniref:Uncharacterized protein n=1 Tax=Trifolium pratense TaxID=57577 RepID=A0A2K3MP94_TRIPR|nr:hypothetical protein L195_g015771 [Trifolium pratense]